MHVYARFEAVPDVTHSNEAAFDVFEPEQHLQEGD
jgi:hypothetical protein